MNFRDLDPEAAQAELQSDAEFLVLDVRTQEEYESHRLPNAVLIPIQDLQLRVDELDATANWLVLCEHGMRSLAACEILTQRGFPKVTNLRGGLAHWAGRGLPLER